MFAYSPEHDNYLIPTANPITVHNAFNQVIIGNEHFYNSSHIISIPPPNHITFLNDIEKVNSISHTLRTATLCIVKRHSVFYDPLASGVIVVRIGFEPIYCFPVVRLSSRAVLLTRLHYYSLTRCDYQLHHLTILFNDTKIL